MDYSKYILRTASCPALGDWAIKNKLVVKWGSAKRGDLVLFDFNGNGTSDHIGFVTKVTSTYIETIEGNTGSGSNTNGDGVYRRRRTKWQVNYFVRTKCPDIEAVIRRAEAELGYKEGRNNSNKYGKWFGMNNVSWCCIFVVYCFAHALGETKPLPKPTGKYTGVIPVPTLKYGSEGIADYIVEQGTTNDWQYIKYASKKFIAWKYGTGAYTCTNASGSMYYSGVSTWNLPFTIVKGVANISLGQQCFASNVNVTTTAVNFRALRGAKASLTNVETHIAVHGTY